MAGATSMGGAVGRQAQAAKDERGRRRARVRHGRKMLVNARRDTKGMRDMGKSTAGGGLIQRLGADRPKFWLTDQRLSQNLLIPSFDLHYIKVNGTSNGFSKTKLNLKEKYFVQTKQFTNCLQAPDNPSNTSPVSCPSVSETHPIRSAESSPC